MNTLIVKNLTKKYPHQIAVNQIDLKIKAGEFVAFLGPNGAGKTTTINMLIGLISPTSGSIELAGLHPADSDYRKKIGVVFQNSLLDKKCPFGKTFEVGQICIPKPLRAGSNSCLNIST